jgi:hypothetical protein
MAPSDPKQSPTKRGKHAAYSLEEKIWLLERILELVLMSWAQRWLLMSMSIRAGKAPMFSERLNNSDTSQKRNAKS